jgi:hypothetical protein
VSNVNVPIIVASCYTLKGNGVAGTKVKREHDFEEVFPEFDFAHHVLIPNKS